MERDIKCTFYFEDLTTNRKRLFEDALLFAKHGKVLYILREELSELPELSQDISSVNRHYMKMISFLYTTNLESLIESVSTLPDWQNVPATIILDDLSGYCNVNNLQNACGVVSFLIDTARSCSSLLKMQSRVCISVTRSSVGDSFCTTLQELYCKNNV